MPRTAKSDAHSVKPQRDLPPSGRPDPAALGRLLQEWMQEDAQEQRETFEFLRRALDEHRPEGYKLFPSASSFSWTPVRWG